MSDLKERVIAYNTEVKAALQMIYDDLNHGQRKSCCVTPPYVHCLSGMGWKLTNKNK